MDLRLLKAEDVPALKPFFERGAPPLSVYSLSALVLWNECINDTLFAVAGESVLLVESPKEDPSKRRLLLPVGGQVPSPAGLRRLAVEAACREIRYIPQPFVEAAGLAALEEHFCLAEQPDYQDYVYLRTDLAELPGRPYAKKRNLVRQFERDHEARGAVRVLDLMKENANLCLECLEEWRSSQEASAPILDCERKAIGAALAGFDRLGLRGIMVEVDGRVQGFGIASRLSADTGVLHFEKASARVKGLYQILDRECARRIFDGATYVNKESDMGDAGLARAKNSYHPIQKVKAYRLGLKP
ncbi:MAG TPA: hypothetical protein DCM05_06585 [Elusimicrobia bacterium]|nr:hypothetical protein [Elusimicrobiota bacterium]